MRSAEGPMRSAGGSVAIREEGKQSSRRARKETDNKQSRAKEHSCGGVEHRRGRTSEEPDCRRSDEQRSDEPRRGRSLILAEAVEVATQEETKRKNLILAEEVKRRSIFPFYQLQGRLYLHTHPQSADKVYKDLSTKNPHFFILKVGRRIVHIATPPSHHRSSLQNNCGIQMVQMKLIMTDVVVMVVDELGRRHMLSGGVSGMEQLKLGITINQKQLPEMHKIVYL
ncbi:hypothetical protein LXL04_014723 [Taraxacum kok-saghyz]